MTGWRSRAQQIRSVLADPRNPLWTPLHLAALTRRNAPREIDRLSVALTFDVENDFGLPATLGQHEGSHRGLAGILSLLEEKEVTATFFVQGCILDAAPALAAAGHEVGYHGHLHRVWGRQPWWLADERVLSLEEKREDLERGLALEGLIGERPRAFRAPYMVADDETLHLLDEMGFRVDSSAPSYLGTPPLPSHPYGLGLLEVPVSALPRPHFMARPVPHWRFDVLQSSFLAREGEASTAALMRRIGACQASRGCEPHAVMLCHPWAFSEHTSVPDERFAYSSSKNLERLGRLVDALRATLDVRFVTMSELAGRLDQ